MKIRKFYIANGNSTALVYDVKSEIKPSLSKTLLQEGFEQVGYITEFASIQKMDMMGGELCINASLAFASTLGKDGKMLVSGIRKPVEYTNSGKTTSIKIDLDYRKIDNLILFDGIGYIILDKSKEHKATKEEMIKLSKKYDLPAFGAILYEGHQIFPRVYVKSVNSFIEETACGSGSIAFAIAKDLTEVVQPSHHIINIKYKKEFEISAGITESFAHNYGYHPAPDYTFVNLQKKFSFIK